MQELDESEEAINGATALLHSNRTTKLLEVDDESVRNAVRALTLEQRKNLLRLAQAVLPEGDPLSGRIAAAVAKLGQTATGAAVDPEIDEIFVATWRAVEAVKNEAGEEANRIIDEYRRVKLAKMEHILSLGTIVDHQLDSIGRAFGDAHQHSPELCAWVYINRVPRPTGPGSLQFCELASRAVHALAGGTASDADWKRWIDVVAGYLLSNDAGEEYIRKYPVCHLDRPEGTTCETHAGVIMQGENYEIRHVLAASALCCSWLISKTRNKGSSSADGRNELAAMAAGGPSTDVSDPEMSTLAVDPIANRLQKAMEQQGYTAPQLASRIRGVLKKRGKTQVKVDRTTIYRIVRGQTKNPDPMVWNTLLEVLKLPADEFPLARSRNIANRKKTPL